MRLSIDVCASLVAAPIALDVTFEMGSATSLGELFARGYAPGKAWEFNVGPSIQTMNTLVRGDSTFGCVREVCCEAAQLLDLY